MARLHEQISAVDPSVRVVDTRPLASNDPNGLDLFYRMLVASPARRGVAEDAVYFNDYQHVRPIAVLLVWAAALFAAWLVVARRAPAR